VTKRSRKRLIEAGSQPDPAGFYFSAFLLFVLGIFGQHFLQYHREESSLKNPVAIEVELVGAQCYQSVKKHGPHMMRTYAYSPGPLQGPRTEYKAYDTVPFETVSDCELRLKYAGVVSPRTRIWYDPAMPSKARWELEKSSPILLIWWTSALSGLLLLTGIFFHRRLKKNYLRERR
jgi:hypothetical protein